MPDVVILGISKPLFKLVISTNAEVLGVVLPMPILCENEQYELTNKKNPGKNLLYINIFFLIIKQRQVFEFVADALSFFYLF